jgi:hypothetical protein
MTEAEYQQLVKDAYRGGTLIGVDRGFARKLYTDVSTAKIRELTGETPYVGKAVVWFAFLGGPLFALTSFVLAGIVFRWWALAVIPVCFVVWFSYKGISSSGGARMFSISLALAAAVGAYLANVIPNRVAALFAVSFLLALWCERLLYCAATFFFSGLRGAKLQGIHQLSGRADIGSQLTGWLSACSGPA